MLKFLVGCFCSLSALLAASVAAANQDSPKLRSVTELRISEYQAEVMAEDLPIQDFMLSNDGLLWVIGKRSLWRWDLAGGRLRRWPLHKRSNDRTSLQKLGSDGLNIFAASGHTLYQLQPAQERLFRYGISDPASDARAKAEFSGMFASSRDDFWLIHSTGVYQFDRYGKRLEQKRSRFQLKSSDRVAFDSSNRRLWIARRNQLLMLDINNPKIKEPAIAFKAKHRLADVQLAGQDVIVHTAHTVLRLDRQLGKLRQSIPVEGRRELLRMAISDDVHAYLFNDRLLEVFATKAQAVARFRLPLDEGEQLGRMQLQGNRLVLEVEGRPRVFILNGF